MRNREEPTRAQREANQLAQAVLSAKPGTCKERKLRRRAEAAKIRVPERLRN